MEVGDLILDNLVVAHMLYHLVVESIARVSSRRYIPSDRHSRRIRLHPGSLGTASHRCAHGVPPVLRQGLVPGQGFSDGGCSGQEPDAVAGGPSADACQPDWLPSGKIPPHHRHVRAVLLAVRRHHPNHPRHVHLGARHIRGLRPSCAPPGPRHGLRAPNGDAGADTGRARRVGAATLSALKREDSCVGAAIGDCIEEPSVLTA
mmetsp:Transcript_41313/g.93456  ORF Transcript_41313/g.93456 Transcript_41313/m.93456 type:complete len:204 (-) Transcript_41313:1163-1774(-)